MDTGGKHVKLSNVNKIFHLQEDVQILYDVNIDFDYNSFNVIFGPSGSGKSTLITILAGMQPPSTGSVLIDNQDIYKFDTDQIADFRSRSIGMVFQTNYWVKSLTVLENVSLPLLLQRDTAISEAHKKSMEILQLVGMDKHAHKLPTQLSGGEQQRVSVARAVVNNPELIVADEPTGNLDTENGHKIMDLLVQCKNEFKSTIVLVTHDLSHLKLGEKLYRIDSGQVALVSQQDVKNILEEVVEDIKPVQKRVVS